MKVEIFEMERFQSLWENRVTHNLSESGVHPMSLGELIDPRIAMRSSTTDSSTCRRTAPPRCANDRRPLSGRHRRQHRRRQRHRRGQLHGRVAAGRAGRRSRHDAARTTCRSGASCGGRAATVVPWRLHEERRWEGGRRRTRVAGDVADEAHRGLQSEQSHRVDPQRGGDACGRRGGRKSRARGCSRTRSIAAPSSMDARAAASGACRIGCS